MIIVDLGLVVWIAAFAIMALTAGVWEILDFYMEHLPAIIIIGVVFVIICVAVHYLILKEEGEVSIVSLLLCAILWSEITFFVINAVYQAALSNQEHPFMCIIMLVVYGFIAVIFSCLAGGALAADEKIWHITFSIILCVAGLAGNIYFCLA